MSPAAAALAALTLLRLVLCAVLPLAPDEAYYWVWSRALSPGYLDHPPMVALWIRIGTAIAGQTELGVRLLGPFAAALGSWMLADAAERLLPGRRAGLVAACLLNATLFVAVGAVVMTPDSPLILFWTATLWAAVRLVAGGGARWWWAVGAFAGLAAASKYTAALLWGGIGLWLLLAPAARAWLRRPVPWLAALLGAALFAPVVMWNAMNGWAGFLRQGGRVGEWQPSRAVQYLAELVGSQVGLATPGVWVLCLAGIVLAVRECWRTRDAGWTLLACLTVPPALMFLQHATGDRVQGNWPAIIYPAAAIAAAGLVAPLWLALRRPSVLLGGVISAAVYAQATLGLAPLPPRLDPIALRLSGWDGLAEGIEVVRRDTGAVFIVAEQYALAAELAWTLPAGVAVLADEPRWALFDLRHARRSGQAGLLIRAARDGDAIDPALWTSAAAVGEVMRTRNGETVEAFRIFRVIAAPGSYAAVELPRRP